MGIWMLTCAHAGVRIWGVAAGLILLLGSRERAANPSPRSPAQWSPACRPRDFYTNLPVETMEVEGGAPHLQQVLTPPAKALTEKAKCIITSNGIEIFATGHTNKFYEHEKRWIDHFNRVYRNKDDLELGFRNFSVEECEKMFGLPRNYTSVLASARYKDFKTVWR